MVRSIESGKDEAPREVVQLAMKDQKFRLTRDKDGQKTNYQVRFNFSRTFLEPVKLSFTQLLQDSDRCGLGSKSNDFEPIFVEYSAPTNYRSDVNQGKVNRIAPVVRYLYMTFLFSPGQTRAWRGCRSRKRSNSVSNTIRAFFNSGIV